jgi:desampylase
MGMAVRISRALRDDLLARAAASPRAEICGILLGTGDAIEGAVAARNVADDPGTRFEIDPAALFAAHRAARAGGPMVIGHYHSHPNGRAEPSACDAEAASGLPPQLWLILADGRALLWRSGVADGLHGAFAAVDLVA